MSPSLVIQFVLVALKLTGTLPLSWWIIMLPLECATLDSLWVAIRKEIKRQFNAK